MQSPTPAVIWLAMLKRPGSLRKATHLLVLLLGFLAIRGFTFNTGCTPGKIFVSSPGSGIINKNNPQTFQSNSMSTDSFKMIIKRVFDAPLEKAWSVWNNEDAVKQWWGPMGFTCPVAKMRFWEGGTSLVCMRPEAGYGGQDMYNTWTYKKITPMEEIEFVLGWSDKDGNTIDPGDLGLPPGMPKEIRHVILFKPMNTGKTEITITEYGYSSSEIVEMSRAGMSQCLDKMAEIFTR